MIAFMRVSNLKVLADRPALPEYKFNFVACVLKFGRFWFGSIIPENIDDSKEYKRWLYAAVFPNFMMSKNILLHFMRFGWQGMRIHRTECKFLSFLEKGAHTRKLLTCFLTYI
jgi:hypothetical protein